MLEAPESAAAGVPGRVAEQVAIVAQARMAAALEATQGPRAVLSLAIEEQTQVPRVGAQAVPEAVRALMAEVPEATGVWVAEAQDSIREPKDVSAASARAVIGQE